MERKTKYSFLLYIVWGGITLVLQSVWQKQLLLITGATVYSISILLSGWMLGLSLGSMIISLSGNRIKSPELFFVKSQMVVMLIALSYFIIFELIQLIRSVIILRSVAFILVLIPATLIGTAFPVLAKIYGQNELAKLYGFNALASSFAVIISNFILLYYFGSFKTALFTVLMGLSLFLVFLISKKIEKGDKVSESAKNTVTEKIKWGLPVIFMLSGFSSLSYSLLYNRKLIYFTGNTLYCYGIITAIFIMGLAMGSILYSKIRPYFNKSREKLWTFLFVLQLIIGLWHIILPKWSVIVNQMLVNMKQIFLQSPVLGTFCVRFCAPMLLILVPVISFGIVFPLVLDLYPKIRSADIERNTGLLVSVNTFGAVVGILVTGFLFFSIFGISGTLRVLSLLNVFISLLIVIIGITKIKKKLAFTGLILIAVFLSLIVKPEDSVSKMAAQGYADHELIYYKEGVHGTVSVSKSPFGKLDLKINGVGEVPTDYNSLRVFKLLAYLPFITNHDAKDVLTIAYGGGITYGSICEIPGVNPLCVEICKDVLDASFLFSEYNHDVHNKKRDTIIIEDGRRYIKNRGNEYDVIIADATHPVSADSWVLYTREFYSLCKKRMRHNGLMAQWLPIHSLSLDDFKSILRTFASVFQYSYLYFCNEYTVLLGADTPVYLSQIGFDRINNNPLIKKDLEKFNLSSINSIENLRVLDERTIRLFSENSQISTDDRSPIQFCEIRSVGRDDTRIDILQEIYDFIDHSMLYQRIVMKVQVYKFQNRYFDAFKVISKNKNALVQKGDWDDELDHQITEIVNYLANFLNTQAGVKSLLQEMSDENTSALIYLEQYIPDHKVLRILIINILYIQKEYQEALQRSEKLYHSFPSRETFDIYLMLLENLRFKEKAEKLKKEYFQNY